MSNSFEVRISDFIYHLVNIIYSINIILISWYSLVKVRRLHTKSLFYIPPLPMIGLSSSYFIYLYFMITRPEIY